MIAPKNILVATDFGEAAEAALAYGRDLARTFGARLHVLHVAEDLTTRYSLDLYPAGMVDMQREVEEVATTRVEALVTAEDRDQLGARPVVRSSNATAAAIVLYATQAAIDLIVIGTHGRGAVSHFLMGSVAERVVRTAPCPVLTIRHPEREFLAPDALAVLAKA
jgi:nucleotide-binding universal stress UspA family protein